MQQRVCYKLTFLRGEKSGHSLADLNYEVARVANRYLIELGLNHALWTRVYRGRVFVYNINTRRAVLELGCDTTLINDPVDPQDRLYSGFALVIMGGIHNKYVTDDLMKLTAIRHNNQRRVKQYARSY